MFTSVRDFVTGKITISESAVDKDIRFLSDDYKSYKIELEKGIRIIFFNGGRIADGIVTDFTEDNNIILDNGTEVNVKQELYIGVDCR